jgi:hypothetical protein
MDPATLAIAVGGLVQLTQAIVTEIQNNKNLTAETQAQLIAQIQQAQAAVPTDPV